MPNNTKNENQISYPFEKKKRLASKISNMRNKTHLRKIKKIIFEENPNITARKNSQGYLMFFHNYNDSTYHKLEKILNKIKEIDLVKQTQSLTETSDNMMLSSEEPYVTDYSKARTRLRYSNREKRLIKRKIYEEIIKNDNKPINSPISSTIITSDENRNPCTNKDPKKPQRKTKKNNSDFNGSTIFSKG